MNAKRTPTYWLTATVVRMFMLGAAGVSFSHIIATSHALGLGWEAWTVPFLIDGLAVLGMIGRSAKFATSTQRAGLRLMVGAGLLSLACNVYAGHNLGQRLYGVLIVAGFVVSEWYAAKLRPAPAPVVAVEPTADELLAAKRSAAAKAAAPKATATKAAKRAEEAAAAQAEADRKAAAAERRRIARQVKAAELAAMETAYAAEAAPVSPAPGEAAAYL